MSDGTLKIRLKAVPEKGHANEELINFLVESLHLSKEDIEIISGFTDARKLVKIPNLTAIPWGKQKDILDKIFCTILECSTL
ncbi:MAG: DUF167 domain-containing protein [Candidatus Gracilibacteria bacterium]